MSSGSESDDDYVPEAPEKLSEEESANEDTDMQFEKELALKNNKKRKITQEKITNKKKLRSNNNTKETVNESDEEKPEASLSTDDPEGQKKKEDDLWAMFLDGTDTKPKSSISTTNTNELSKSTVNNIKVQSSNQVKDDEEAREKRIFEFAGEKIVVENNVIKEKIKIAESPASGSKLGGPSRNQSGVGLSSVLGQLNKKNKLSTLEKSKLDWTTFKKEEGIEEEIQSHNKGKKGYLDRQDFLERADVRQYEIERDLRLTRRSNR